MDDIDIVDINYFYTNAKESQQCFAALKADPDLILELAILIGNDDEGITDRGYAQIINGKLPECFDNGYKVPKRVHEIMRKYFNKPLTL